MTELGCAGETERHMTNQLPIVYYKPGCPFGARLRVQLALHGVPYAGVRFRDDPSGAAQVRSVNGGNEISPTVCVNGRWLTNPPWRDVRAALREDAGEQSVVPELRP